MTRNLLLALLLMVLPASMTMAQEAAPSDQVAASFPQGVDWNNATPEQMYSAIYNAVKNNPDATLDIVQSSLNNIERTGRYPRAGNGGGKEVIEDNGQPREPRTFEDMALEVGKAATAANPAMTQSIANLINGLVPTLPPQVIVDSITGAEPPPADPGGSGGEGTPGVFLPSGSGGGGGGGGTPSS